MKQESANLFIETLFRAEKFMNSLGDYVVNKFHSRVNY